GLALAWALPVAGAGGPAYAAAILWGQTAGRMVHSFAHRRPFWWYLLWLPVILYPWIVQRRLWRDAKRLVTDEGCRFCLSWLVPSVAILSLVSGKQTHYLLPILPAAALLMAGPLAAPPAGPLSPQRWAVALPCLVIGIALLLLPFVASRWPALNLPESSFWAWGLMPLALGVYALIQRPPNAAVWVRSVPVFIVALMVVLQLGPVRSMEAAYDIADFSKQIAAVADSGAPVAVFPAKFEGQFQFLGRLKNPLVTLDDIEAVHAWLHQHPDGYLVIVFNPQNWNIYGKGAATVQKFRSRWLALWPAAALAKKFGAS
ncbi:MAG: hypothetical protein WAO07_07315, partial [Desulfobacterales bacterium]